jgi:hypothetical protein
MLAPKLKIYIPVVRGIDKTKQHKTNIDEDEDTNVDFVALKTNGKLSLGEEEQIE